MEALGELVSGWTPDEISGLKVGATVLAVVAMICVTIIVKELLRALGKKWDK